MQKKYKSIQYTVLPSFNTLFWDALYCYCSLTALSVSLSLCSSHQLTRVWSLTETFASVTTQEMWCKCLKVLFIQEKLLPVIHAPFPTVVHFYIFMPPSCPLKPQSCTSGCLKSRWEFKFNLMSVWRCGSSTHSHSPTTFWPNTFFITQIHPSVQPSGFEYLPPASYFLSRDA